MLYTRHLGLKASIIRRIEEGKHDQQKLIAIEKDEPRAFAIWKEVEGIKAEYRHKDVLKPKAVYQFFKVHSLGRKVHVYKNPEDKTPITTLEFVRQKRGDRLCLADYVHPESGKADNIAFFVVSVGSQLRNIAEDLKNQGQYLKSHILQALAIESAEAYAELLHAELRKGWGFADEQNLTMIERFQAKYRGKRYSFGYPACPDLEDQRILFDLLKPEEIGVELTEGFMMDPEASVSAVVFHHPQAKYFGV
jgi:5-methyltetrahydrofolate--homocysteine methyltransferase